MRSSFFGLNTLLRALQAQQQALDTTNHNIANANTQGYSRQVASMSATHPYTLPAVNRPASYALHVGTGVLVQYIKRQRDAFVDLELRQQTQTTARWEALADGLRQVEGIFSDPSDHGLSSTVTRFFNAWSELANNPTSSAAREVVRSNGEALAIGFNDLAQRLTQMRRDVNGAIALKVNEISDLTRQLGTLNEQIMKAVSVGDQPNDLRDKRDLLLDELVKLTGATYREEANGSTTVLLGGRVLVSESRVNRIVAEPRTLGSGVTIHRLLWAADGEEVVIGNGSLKGQMELRDTILPEKMRSLDLLATTIATTVNRQQRNGFGIGTYAAVGRHTDFFDPMLRGAATLNTTGLGNDLVQGKFTVTIGGGAPITVEVSPTVDSLDSVLKQVTTAIDAATGTSSNATWEINAVTGRIEIRFQAATATTVTFGAATDTTNLLQLLGLQGAKMTTENVGPPAAVVHTITGLAPVALMSAAHLRLDPTIRLDLEAIAAALGTISTTGATDLTTGNGFVQIEPLPGMLLGSYRLAVDNSPGGPPWRITLYRMNGGVVADTEAVTVTPPASPDVLQDVLFTKLGVRIVVNSSLGTSQFGASATSELVYDGPPTGPGSNRNALFLANLARTRFEALGDATFDDFYGSLVAQLGVQTRQAEQIGENQRLLTQHLERRRESISGVSLDEEATQLIRFQRAYQAAARGISALDEMLETIITRMGRVGT